MRSCGSSLEEAQNIPFLSVALGTIFDAGDPKDCPCASLLTDTVLFGSDSSSSTHVPEPLKNCERLRLGRADRLTPRLYLAIALQTLDKLMENDDLLLCHKDQIQLHARQIRPTVYLDFEYEKYVAGEERFEVRGEKDRVRWAQRALLHLARVGKVVGLVAEGFVPVPETMIGGDWAEDGFVAKSAHGNWWQENEGSWHEGSWQEGTWHEGTWQEGSWQEDSWHDLFLAKLDRAALAVHASLTADFKWLDELRKSLLAAYHEWDKSGRYRDRVWKGVCRPMLSMDRYGRVATVSTDAAGEGIQTRSCARCIEGPLTSLAVPGCVSNMRLAPYVDHWVPPSPKTPRSIWPDSDYAPGARWDVVRPWMRGSWREEYARAATAIADVATTLQTNTEELPCSATWMPWRSELLPEDEETFEKVHGEIDKQIALWRVTPLRSLLRYFRFAPKMVDYLERQCALGLHHARKLCPNTHFFVGCYNQVYAVLNFQHDESRDGDGDDAWRQFVNAQTGCSNHRPGFWSQLSSSSRPDSLGSLDSFNTSRPSSVDSSDYFPSSTPDHLDHPFNKSRIRLLLAPLCLTTSSVHEAKSKTSAFWTKVRLEAGSADFVTEKLKPGRKKRSPD
ncbi:hypothetical protein GNI_182900 [Gregarina niphandrodes]|uniref:Uncharacterized protein n=1 Tax=Gregarina niphandrodes TaxID=110365 RepID=A0A023AY32_GRENI|nr:hypothetical protein GNI_182900 [Gregarina niphandrodes]EZG43200.1 hypothetical protein GNI_182900 [Gregarina niphandrodes]|eukprot:XP_011133543.1 hypothetical protein GNI_182900 [Gregarina niphandrodes]